MNEEEVEKAKQKPKNKKEHSSSSVFDYWNKRPYPKELIKLLPTLQREADKQISQFIRDPNVPKFSFIDNCIIMNYINNILPGLWSDPNDDQFKRCHLDMMTNYAGSFVWNYVFNTSPNIGKADKQATLANEAFMRAFK